MLCLPAPATGQIPAQPINQPCTACEPTAVHAADLNGDGDPDVLSASMFDEKLAWYENTGSGYGEQKVIDSSLPLDSDYNNQPMHAADVDDDGDLDVVAGSGVDNTAVWYENQMGEGGADSDGFGPAQTITASHGGVYAVAAAQIDGDDKADVVLGTSDSGIIWFESQIGESGDDFSSANTIASPFEALDPTNIVLADFSGNSNPDVAYAVLGEIAWHENTGGSFSSKTSINNSTNNGLAVGDVDDDSDPDLIASSSFDANVTWYENTGGAFGGETVIQSGVDAQAVATADVDADGNTDVFSALLDGTVSWHESQVGEAGAPSSGFGSAQEITASLLAPRDLATANLDGGSDVELLSGSEIDDKIAWYENTGGGYGAPQPVNTWPDAIQPHSVVAAALDADSDVDVLVSSTEDGKVSWYENTDGDGTFSAQNLIASDARRPQEAIAADLNNDNKPDAIVVSDGTGSTIGMVAWYENQTGEGSADADEFGSQQIIAEKEGMSHVFAADLDGDTDKDIVATYGGAGTGEQSLVWYENRVDENSGFAAEQVIAGSLTLIESLHVADLNGGGNDIILGSGNPYDDATSVVWYENTDGNGNFASAATIDGSLGDDTAISLTTASIDGDSDLDVVAGLFDIGSEDVIVWYENQVSQGSGFARTEITSAIARPLGLYTADVNDNGNPDLISASRDDDKVAWYKNTGGAFSSQTVVSSFNQGTGVQGAESVFAADVNGDNKMDVLSSATGREEIAWYENTGTILPVELAGLDATVDDGAVTLSWTTASETNNAGFRVQRKPLTSRGGVKASRRDGSTWTTVGSVEGSGTTSKAQAYRFTDDNLPYETDALTYRLKQVDTDGTTHYSKTITVERGVSDVQLLGTYPNPARQQATVRYALPERQDVTVRLYDVLGRQVRTVVSDSKDGRHEQTLDVSGLSSGVYFLRLQADGETRTQKITVTR